MQKKIIVTKKTQSNAPKTVVQTTTTTPQRGKPRRARRRAARRPAIPPYVATLLNPDGVRGVSIPDTISMATGTYAYVTDFSIPVDTLGNGVVFLNPKMLIGNALALANSANGGLRVGSATGTGGYGNATNGTTGLQDNPDLSGNVERFRVVSAELQAWSPTAPVNIQGRVFSGLLPSDYDNSVGGVQFALNSASAFSNAPNCIATHAIEGGRSLYVPGGPDDLLYAPCNSDNPPIHGYLTVTGAVHGTTFAANGTQTTPSGPTCFIAINNANASTAWNGRAIVNIQYQAASNNTFAQLEPVVPDPQAIAMANVVASFPRKLQGFYESHAERLSGLFDQAVSAGFSLAQQIAPVVARSAMSTVTNALLGSRMGTRPGGVSASSFPRLM